MAELTAQINVRMNKEEKERGDAALASIGYTASEAIRALWSRAASGARGLIETKRCLEGGAAEEVDLDEWMRPVCEGMTLYDQAIAQLEEMVGRRVDTDSDDMPTNEYIDMLRTEHYCEKGLL